MGLPVGSPTVERFSSALEELDCSNTNIFYVQNPAEWDTIRGHSTWLRTAPSGPVVTLTIHLGNRPAATPTLSSN
jgi:hypothetical protein